MKIFQGIIFIILLFLRMPVVTGQPDIEPPAAPVLNLVTVQTESGITSLLWTRSVSPDVEGYVIYHFRNNEGFAFDTVWNPLASGYSDLSASASERIESYVVAAIDTAGNISPLSNSLNTIYAESKLDTCKKVITISWNSYSSTPFKVAAYKIFVSENGAPCIEKGTVSPDSQQFTTQSFTTGIYYCFYVRAELEEGSFSNSSKTCRQAVMQRPPEWINADFVTVNENNKIDLSFTIDPLSEIKLFNIGRKDEDDSEFIPVSSLNSVSNKITFTDIDADPYSRHVYRLSAINLCNIPVVYSNKAENLVLKITHENNLVKLFWNSYKEWNGGINRYSVFIDTGNGFGEIISLPPSDTTWTLNYSDLMYQVSTGEICFYIFTAENLNEYNIQGASRSSALCLDIIENLTVPNAFTPDNDFLNDDFRPFLSFTPHIYKLIVTDRHNKMIFETSDPLQAWDGTSGGSPAPQGVYLWFLKTTTPSGKVITRTGTIAVIRNK